MLDKTAEYPKLTYLQALKEDHQELLKEIAKCSADRNYKSGFVAKSEQFASKAMQQDTQDNTIQDNTPEKSEKEDTLASKEKLETRMQQEAAQHPSASRANRADNTIQENYLEEIKTMNAFLLEEEARLRAELKREEPLYETWMQKAFNHQEAYWELWRQCSSMGFRIRKAEEGQEKSCHKS
ncbi:hypothetical protein [Helicobacter suis]|uniref:hypothetical protein n=1 Tax=Helicobacter suis TaxID=104628 RepID=UPI001596695B|nr:hypothetical protein [Helicobacter suis]BCD50204.1 hypothetical protein NHP194004_16510 [Helicobacter suis]